MLRKTSSGQTFVVVFMLMMLALTIGITISTRFISGMHVQTESNNVTRAQAVAEAGIERMLLVSNDTLDGYITYNNCGSNCVVTITDPSGQVLTSTIKLSYEGNSTAPYVVTVAKGDVTQVSLSGFTSGKDIYICWDTQASVYASYIYKNGTVTSSTVYAYNPASGSAPSNGFLNAASYSGHTSCFTVTATNTPSLLRIKPYYVDSDIFVIPSPGQSIPKQGILITSTGTASGTSRTVRAMKTDPIMPALFDYGLIQKSKTDTLSNSSL